MHALSRSIDSTGLFPIAFSRSPLIYSEYQIYKWSNQYKSTLKLGFNFLRSPQEYNLIPGWRTLCKQALQSSLSSASLWSGGKIAFAIYNLWGKVFSIMTLIWHKVVCQITWQAPDLTSLRRSLWGKRWGSGGWHPILLPLCFKLWGGWS